MSPRDPRAPALIVSTTFLARIAGAASATTAATELLLISITPGSDAPAGACIHRFADADPLPSLHRAVACSSDDIARVRLAAGDIGTVSLLPDAGHPTALWRAAERLGLCGWLDTPSDPTCVAGVLARLADVAGLAGQGQESADRLAAALELLVACLGGGHGAGPQALRAAAVRAGLWPRPALGVGLLPAPFGTSERAVLRGAVGAPTLFRAAADALRDHAPPGLLPAPSPRPALLGPVPPSSDPVEAETLAHLRSLADPLPLLPAPDPIVLQARLCAEFPWMEEAIRAVVRGIALRSHGDGAALIPPTLLIGPPGVGKTRFARVLAELCGLPWRRLVVADAAAVTALTGNGRGWRGGRPCLAAATIAETGVLNPMVVVDDVDRAATDDRHGTPANYLLSQIERESARAHLDLFLMAAIDVSEVSWLLTANSIAALPGALLDRLHVVEVGPPPPAAIDGLVQSIVADVAAELGLPDAGALPRLPAVTVDFLRQAVISGDASVRLLDRALRQGLGALLLGDDALAVIRTEMARARCRDDRPYAARRVGFHVPAREMG